MGTEVQTTDVNFAPQVPKYEVFEGPRRIDVEVAIAKDNRQKAPVAGLMQFRLDALKSGYEPAIELAWSRWYDTSNWSAYRDGIVKIGEGFEMPENPKLENGALVLTEKQFDDLQGETFSRKELEKADANDWLAKSQVLKHPVWQAVAGSELLEQYADAQFSRYGNEQAMGVYLASAQDKPTMRALVLDGGGNYRSNLYNCGLFDYYGARLVGVQRGTLEDRVQKQF